MNPMDLKRGVDQAVAAVVKELHGRSKKIKTEEEISQVGTVSSNGELEIMNRSFMLEKENDCIQGLMLTPADRTTIYFGKLISNLIFLLIMEAFILPLFMLFFNVDLLSNLGPILLAIFLGTLGFCAIGTLLSSLSSNLKTREIMLPILLYPLMVPVIIGAVRMTGQLLDGETLASMTKWIGLILCFDIIYIGVSIMTIDYIFEE